MSENKTITKLDIKHNFLSVLHDVASINLPALCFSNTIDCRY